MAAVVGEDHALWDETAGFFTPNTPLWTEYGGDILKQKDIEAGRKLIAEAGHQGTKVLLIVGTNLQITRAQSDVTADLLTKLGLNVDYVAADIASVIARRANKGPPDKGGWNIVNTFHGAVECVNPGMLQAYQTTGDNAWFGWPKSDEVQGKIATWFEAASEDQEKAAVREVNKAECDFATFLPTGFFRSYEAWRTSLSNMVQAPFPTLWGVRKT